MSVSTDKLIPGVLPPKEETAKVDFLGILDAFDPSVLTLEVLDVFAGRNPFVTLCGSEERYYHFEGCTYLVPDMPAEKRLGIARVSMRFDREELIDKAVKYDAGLPNAYKNCRRVLIKAIGSKACLYIVEKEAGALTDEEKRQQETDYARYEKYVHESYERARQEEAEDYWEYGYDVSVSEKIVQVRKGTKNSSGKYFTQRDFAKLIGYPIQKYAAAEKDDNQVDEVLLEKLIMICHANPYYLYDDECEAFMGEYGGDAVKMGDAPAVIVDLGVIYKWIQDGRPRVTNWFDSVTEP